jgi:hypothetical protein
MQSKVSVSYSLSPDCWIAMAVGENCHYDNLGYVYIRFVFADIVL